MKAMVLREFGTPMNMEEIEAPTPQSGEALIRVGATGLCATDVKVFDGSIPTVRLPIVPGHELAGEIIQLGTDGGESGLSVGDRVAIHMVLPCGACKPCQLGIDNNCERAERVGYERPGGFGEFVAVPLDRLARVDDSVPIEAVSIITGTISTSYNALRQGQIQSGEVVVIFGVGGLGIHAVQIAAALGAHVVAVDIDDEKLALASTLGASETVNAQDDAEKLVRGLTNGSGADAAIVFVGGRALETVFPQAFGLLRRAGRLIVVGYLAGVDLKVDSNELVYMTWQVIGARSSTMDDLREAVRMVEDGTIKPIISSHWQLAEANEALEALRNESPVGRMVLVPG